jgi:hypothetical protein
MKTVSNILNKGNVAMNPEILAIYTREIRAAARESFGLSPQVDEEILDEEAEAASPKVQTHASPTKSGLGRSHKKTMTSRLIAIPTRSYKLFRGSDIKLKRIVAVAGYVKKQHGVILKCRRNGNVLTVTRIS